MKTKETSNKVTCNQCGKQKTGSIEGICEHCGKFGNVKSTREQALAWWKNLLNEDIDNDTRIGRELVDKYCLGIGRTFSSLTGREIEEIWRKETQMEITETSANKTKSWLNLSKEDIDVILPKSKPNQKQFKEGNDDLFRAYINKFSQEYKARMLQILIDDLGVRALVDESLRS